MAKFFFFIFGLCSFSLFAQIPSLGFEKWDSSMGVWHPEGWTSTNLLQSLGNPPTVFRDSNAYQGKWCLQIKTRFFPVMAPGTPRYNGWAATGFFDGKTVQGSFPLNGMYPTNLNAYIEFIPVADDTGYIFTIMTRYNSVSQRRDTVGIGAYPLIDYQPTWAQISLPIEYKLGALPPDSASIYIFGNNQKSNDSGTLVRIDELQYKGQVTNGMDISSHIASFAYPFPAREYIYFPILPNEHQIINASGQIMGNVPSGAQSLTVSGWENGFYYIRNPKNNQVFKVWVLR